MHCTVVRVPGGTVMVCGGGRQLPGMCHLCGKRAVVLCDYPTMRSGVEGTCDKAMCRECAVSTGPTTDLCPSHTKVAAQLQLNFGGQQQQPGGNPCPEQNTAR